MCVWQSQACGGISKFTGVAGWEAFAKLGRLRARTPVAMAPVRKLHRVSMVAPFISRPLKPSSCNEGPSRSNRLRARLAMYLLREMQTRLCEPARPVIAGLRQRNLTMPNRKAIAVSEAKLNDTHRGRRLPKRNRRLFRRASHDLAQTCRRFVGSLYNKSR